MKKAIGILMALIMTFSVPVFAKSAESSVQTGETNAKAVEQAPKEMEITASSAIVINAGNMFVHYAHNEQEKRSMASTTKIMTALLIIENTDLDEIITVTDKMVRVEGTSMGLLPDDKVSYRDLAYGMLLESGNDAANAAAIACAGSIEAFAEMMNERARDMGLKNTNFVNPSGLTAENHYSTAYDMAVLGANAIKNPVFADICSTESIRTEFGNPPAKRTLRNHNKLLTENRYDGVSGIKTGFTKKAGRCLVSSVKKDGNDFVCVTLNAPDDWNDHVKMYDYAISMYVPFKADLNLGGQKLKIAGGTKPDADILCDPNTQDVMIPSGWEPLIQRRLSIRKFEYAPVQEGKTVGYVEYLYDGEAFLRFPVYLCESVEATTYGWFSSHLKMLKNST